MKGSLELIEKIAEDRYYKEHERNEKINNSLSVPIAIIVALIGVVGFYIINIPFKIINTPIGWVVFCLFTAVLIVLIFCIIGTIYFLSKIFLGMTYAYIPNPKQIHIYVEKLGKFYKASRIKNIDKNVEKETRKFIIDAYCTCTENNIKLNEEKNFYLTKAKKYIILTLVFLMLSSIPFVILHYRDKNLSESVQKIEIIKEK